MVDTIKGAEYTIHKRGADGKRGVIIDKYIALQIEQRWTEPSKFVITGKELTRVPLTIGDGVDIYRDGALFLTGVVDTAEESCDEMQHGIIDWTVTGRDITSLLERRLVLPDPVGLNFSEAVQDVMTDTVGNAIRRYVERNAGESAATGRRLGSLTVDVAEPDEGNTYAYRLMTLDKVCAEIGAGEAMPVIDWNPETGDIELNVITRREKADTVIFSPVNGTITRWTKKKKLPKANALWAISGGDEQIVTYTQHAQSIAAYGRFEGYIKDSAQMQEATEEEPAVTAEDVAAILENKSAEKLNKEAATESYSVDVCESPSLRFIEHWKCGDRVTCIIDGEEIVSTIESVSIFTSQTGERLSAKIGEVERGIFAELFEQIAELQEKVEVEQAITSVVVNGGGGGSVNFETNPANIKPDGTASVGALDTVARADHAHPDGDTGWINVSLGTGWTGSIKYRKIGEIVNVIMWGVKKDSTIAAWEAAANLPVGYRPANNMMFPALQEIAHGTYTMAILFDGSIRNQGTTIPANVLLSANILFLIG